MNLHQPDLECSHRVARPWPAAPNKPSGSPPSPRVHCHPNPQGLSPPAPSDFEDSAHLGQPHRVGGSNKTVTRHPWVPGQGLTSPGRGCSGSGPIQPSTTQLLAHGPAWLAMAMAGTRAVAWAAVAAHSYLASLSLCSPKAAQSEAGGCRHPTAQIAMGHADPRTSPEHHSSYDTTSEQSG